MTRPRKLLDEPRQARDDLAEVMAQGCPTLAGAARTLRLSQAAVEQHWQAICAALGEQAI